LFRTARNCFCSSRRGYSQGFPHLAAKALSEIRPQLAGEHSGEQRARAEKSKGWSPTRRALRSGQRAVVYKAISRFLEELRRPTKLGKFSDTDRTENRSLTDRSRVHDWLQQNITGSAAFRRRRRKKTASRRGILRRGGGKGRNEGVLEAF